MIDEPAHANGLPGGLARLVSSTAVWARGQFGVAEDQLAISLADLTHRNNIVWAHERGDAPTYPASVIKLFYLVATHAQMSEGRLSDTPEVRRAMRDMIVDSSNDATNYLVDLLTGTTSGPELSPAELAFWNERRNVVNRYFHAHGYPEINANRKTWHDSPFGRDWQAVQILNPGRNSVTTHATARLLKEIADGTCVSPERSRQMLELLKRDNSDAAKLDYQAREFIGAALPSTAKLWSKAGYMSQVRHDAALIELLNGRRFILVIFTTGHSARKEIIPEIARRFVEAFLS